MKRLPPVLAQVAESAYHEQAQANGRNRRSTADRWSAVARAVVAQALADGIVLPLPDKRRRAARD